MEKIICKGNDKFYKMIIRLAEKEIDASDPMFSDIFQGPARILNYMQRCADNDRNLITRVETCQERREAADNVFLKFAKDFEEALKK